MLLPLVGLVTFGIYFLLDCYFIPKHASNEPPLVNSYIPYVGHIIGLLRHGTLYYQVISARCRLPIFTLPALNGKIYVVTDLDLINAVNRNSKILAFNPFIAQLGKRITGHDEATGRVVQHNLTGENGPGYVTEVHDGTVSSLAPGEDLERMTNAMLLEASSYLDALNCNTVIDLFAWMKHVVTLASTQAIYGSQNPFNKDEERFVKAFWDFDHSLNALIINILPSLTVPKGNRARAELGLAFQRYFEGFAPGKNQCAAIAETRSLINRKYAISTWNQGRLEVGTLLGILANTVPAIFYLVVHIFSDPALLEDIRTEIETMAVHQFDAGRKRSLRVRTMREKCVLLHAAFQELLRLHALGTSVRYVREDIVLQDKYLLKKGMVVRMPMACLHSDPSAWGTDVEEYNPRRFLKPRNDGKETKSSATAYRPFRGGSSLCPGRHFVTLEAMALAATMALRIDVLPVGGKWTMPKQKQESMATNVFPPERDIKVVFRRRKGYEEVTWDFDMS